VDVVQTNEVDRNVPPAFYDRRDGFLVHEREGGGERVRRGGVTCDDGDTSVE
jgi:hypothetical protein